MTKNACCVWDFTLHKGSTPCKTWEEFEMYYKVLLKIFPKYCKKFTFQLEKGNETERMHYQCRISLGLKTRTPSTVITELIPSPKYDPTSNENRDNDFYVMKPERLNGPWTEKDKEVYIPIQWRGKENSLLPFQKTIWDMCSKGYLDDRYCNIVYNFEGNIGKSTIAHLCRLHLGGLVMPPINDGERLMYTAHNMMVFKNPKRISIPVFFDLPRAMCKERLHGIFTTIEVMKTGYLSDTRNQFKDYDVDSPNIWVFTNELPENTNYLSQDRWKLWTVNEKRELVQFRRTASCNTINCTPPAQPAQTIYKKVEDYFVKNDYENYIVFSDDDGDSNLSV